MKQILSSTSTNDRPAIERALAIVVSAVMMFCALRFAVKNDVLPQYIKVCISVGYAGVACFFWYIDARKSEIHALHRSSKIRQSSFDWSMHYFRAAAILAIMLTHYAGMCGYRKLVNILFHSSTIYFLFISGYLSQYIGSIKRDVPIQYYKKKIVNVILPFILFSFLFGAVKYKIDILSVNFLHDLVLGRVLGPYWYIPFVSIIFLATPFLLRLNDTQLLKVTLVSSICFIVFPFRPSCFVLAWPEMFYLYAYFLPFYLFGIVYCRFKKIVDNFLIRNFTAIVIASILLVALLSMSSALGLSHSPDDLLIGLHRMSIVAMLLVVLRKLPNSIVSLKYLADYSFALYFIHAGVFKECLRLHDRLLPNNPFLIPFFELSFFLFLVVLLMLGIYIFKKSLGSFSRHCIGA